MKLEPRIFERTDKIWEEKLFFNLQMTTRNTTKITEILRENEKQRGWANNDKNLNEILEKACDWWNPFLRHTWKEFENNSERIRSVRQDPGKRHVG